MNFVRHPIMTKHALIKTTLLGHTHDLVAMQYQKPTVYTQNEEINRNTGNLA